MSLFFYKRKHHRKVSHTILLFEYHSFKIRVINQTILLFESGSFKIRGVVNQMQQVRKKHGEDCDLVTMSAGNYGKAFAYCMGRSGVRTACIMPATAPKNRVTLIEVINLFISIVHIQIYNHCKILCCFYNNFSEITFQISHTHINHSNVFAQ